MGPGRRKGEGKVPAAFRKINKPPDSRHRRAMVKSTLGNLLTLWHFAAPIR
jgi:hypothetical protein